MPVYKYVLTETNGEQEYSQNIFVRAENQSKAEKEAKRIERTWYEDAVKTSDGYEIPDGPSWKLEPECQAPTALLYSAEGQGTYEGLVVARPIGENGRYADTLLQLTPEEVATIVSSLSYRHDHDKLANRQDLHDLWERILRLGS
jgi:hypothetical protein